MFHFRKTCALALACCFLLMGLRPAQGASPAPPPPPSAEQMKSWIADLAAEDFQRRTDAKKALLDAGKAAIPYLKGASNSADIEVKNSVAAILAQLKWCEIPAHTDYLALFPADAIMAFSISKISEVVAQSKISPLGKLITGDTFKPVFDLVVQKINANPAEKGIAQKWFGRFQGGLAGSIWKFNPMNPQEMGMAAIAELPTENTEAIFKELLAETGVGAMLQPQLKEGLSMLIGPDNMGAVALVGNHLIVAPNENSLLKVAKGLVEGNPENLTQSAEFKKLKPHLNAVSHFTFLLNLQAYKEMLGPFMGMLGGGGMPGLLDKMGYDTFQTMAMSTTIGAEGVEDRFLITMNEKPTKTNAILEMAFKGNMPLNQVFAVAPADAIMIGNAYMEGQTMAQWTLDYIKALMEMQGAAMAQMGQERPDLDALIAKAEGTAGVKLNDLAAAVKGNTIYWMQLADTLAPPDLGAALTCVDAAKAAEFAANLAKMIDGVCKMATEKAAPAIEKVVKEGVTIHTESADSPWMATPERNRVPYRLAWAAEGAQVIMGSSVDSLLKRIKALRAKEAGFDPKVVMPKLKAGEAEPKTVFALRLNEILNYGVKFGLPLTAPLLQTQPDLRAAVAKLAQNKNLFGAVYPLTISGHAPKGGVMVSTMQSPGGVLPAYGLVLGGFLVGCRQSAAGIEVVAPPPPGGF